MFTGLIEEIGSVLWIRATDRGTQLQIAAPQIAEDVRKGDSIAVNGCCLTVTARRGEQLTFDLLEETLDRTNLRTLRRESAVNLERAIAAGSRMGGHFVQGHIDCAVRVLSFEEAGADHRLEVELPADFAHYVTYKGSVALNGSQPDRGGSPDGEVHRLRDSAHAPLHESARRRRGRHVER